jgi:hypothetical protein
MMEMAALEALALAQIGALRAVRVRHQTAFTDRMLAVLAQAGAEALAIMPGQA